MPKTTINAAQHGVCSVPPVECSTPVETQNGWPSIAGIESQKPYESYSISSRESQPHPELPGP